MKPCTLILSRDELLISTSDLCHMELAKPRLDPSLWQSRSNGTTVSPDMLGRLVKWFRENRTVWKP